MLVCLLLYRGIPFLNMKFPYESNDNLNKCMIESIYQFGVVGLRPAGGVCHSIQLMNDLHYIFPITI